MTSFDDRHLSAASEVGTSFDGLLESRYDYVLTGSSWDQRCLALSSADITSSVTQVLLPRNRGWSDLRSKHDEILSDYWRSHADHLDIIEEESEALEAVFSRIEGAISTLRKAADQPLSMLIDLSAMPRYFTLGAVAIGLNNAVAGRVDVVYAEGIYGPLRGQSQVEIPEHPGSWEAVAIPGLEGDWYPNHDRHFLVSVGFESTKVARLADRWDPDVISVLFPRPGTDPNYEQEAEKANSMWLKQFGVSSDRIIDCSPSDAVRTWATLSTAEGVDAESENVYCLLCGPKPHALGVSLYSLARERPAVMYVRPTVHEEKEIRPNGRYWIYRVRDRTLVL